MIQQTNQLAEFEKFMFKYIKVKQSNKLSIKGKLLDVIADSTGLHKILIEQEFIAKGKVGDFFRSSRPTVATVYTKNISTVEVI